MSPQSSNPTAENTGHISRLPLGYAALHQLSTDPQRAGAST